MTPSYKKYQQSNESSLFWQKKCLDKKVGRINGFLDDIIKACEKTRGNFFKIN